MMIYKTEQKIKKIINKSKKSEKLKHDLGLVSHHRNTLKK